jgi:hypothetical protein
MSNLGFVRERRSDLVEPVRERRADRNADARAGGGAGVQVFEQMDERDR